MLVNKRHSDYCQLCVDDSSNSIKTTTQAQESLFCFQVTSEPLLSSRSAEQIRIEMLTCENTTPRCNPHLEDKPTVGKPACKI